MEQNILDRILRLLTVNFLPYSQIEKKLFYGSIVFFKSIYPDLRYETTGHDAPVVECAGAGPGHLIWTVTVSGAPGLLIRAVVVISHHLGHGHPLPSLLTPHDK